MASGLSPAEIAQRLGIDYDFFQISDAGIEDENKVEKCLVDHQLLNLVYGRVASPVSFVVFGAKGSGKTALRLMVRRRFEREEHGNICIELADFRDIDELGNNTDKLDSIRLSYFLRRIIGSILLGLFYFEKDLSHEGEPEGVFSRLDGATLKIFHNLCDRYLPTDLPAEVDEYRHNVRGLWGNLKDVAKSVNVEKIAFTVAAFSVSTDFADRPLMTKVDEDFKRLESLLKTLGVRSVYILIDSIDETDLLHDPENAGKFISSILNNQLVSSSRLFGFKFFLPDSLDSPRFFKRSDKVRHKIIRWTPENLKRLIEKRLSAYSNDSISTLQQIVEVDVNVDLVYELIGIFAQGIPRTAIRILNEILDKQVDYSDSFTGKFSQGAIFAGIEAFVEQEYKEFSQEDNVDYGELIEIWATTSCMQITPSQLAVASGLTLEDARSKLVYWAAQSGKVQRLTRSRSVNDQEDEDEYIVTDIYLARKISQHPGIDLSLVEFVHAKTGWCRICAHPTLLIRDFDKMDSCLCHVGKHLMTRP